MANGAEARTLTLGRPLLMGKLALFAATPGMVAGCCYVIDVTVDSNGIIPIIVLEKTDARPLGAPGSARAAARVAHHPPVVARGPVYTSHNPALRMFKTARLPHVKNPATQPVEYDAKQHNRSMIQPS